MSEAVYAVVFRGEILDGFSREQVQEGFARLFGLGPERIEQLFAHPRVVLKKGLSENEAARYRDTLHGIGARVTLESPAAAAAPVPPAPRVEPVATPPAPADSPAPVPPAAAPVPAPALQAVAVATAAASGLALEPAPTVDAGRNDGGGAPPAATGTRAATDDEAAPRLLPFEFSGDGFEFFRIWIVNVLLSIVTLGIYSAWAKVRTQRYFYGNTRLDGSSFDYLANPLQILKGRVIAFVAFVLYSVAGELSVVLGGVVMLLLLVAFPWMIVKGLSFRNHNTAWRGVRFGFDGSYGGAAMAFLLWPLAGMLTLGLLMPLALRKQQLFIVDNSRYGTARFQLDVGLKPFYMMFLVVIGIGLVGGIAAVVIGGVIPPLMPLLMAAVYLVVFAFFNVRFTNLVYGNTVLAEHSLTASYEIGSYARLMLVNLVGMMLTLGLFYPWARVRNARYAAEHIALFAADDLDGFVAARRAEVSAMGGEFGDLFDVDVGL